MLDLIVDSWSNSTMRTTLEARIADVSSQMSFISNLLITNTMFDTIQDKTEAQYWLLRRGDLSDYYSIVESYIEDDKFDSAFYYLNMIPDLFAFTDEQYIEFNNFTDYLTFKSTIAASGRTIMQLTGDEIGALQQIANNNNGRSTVLAQNILCFAYQLCKDYIPAENNREHIKINKPVKSANQILNDAFNKITVSPNPAKDYTIFTWSLPLLKSNAVLYIIDINGKIIEQKVINTKNGQWIWDTRKNKKGIYMYDIKSENQNLGSGKILLNN